jgi:molybdopterin-guanine dinucleotide biosynthesis protein A
MSALAACVLSGGKSSRMGRDKSLIRIQKKTLTALTVAKLLKAGFGPVFVVGPKKAYGLPKDIEIIGEKYRGFGPLSGIEAALRHAKKDCMVVPCDLPYLSIALLKRLKRAHRQGMTACRDKPLPAIFGIKMLTQIQKKLLSKRLAIFPLLEKARLIKAPGGNTLLNLNDSAALERLKSGSARFQ